jgi:hypothetical protein
MNGFDAINSGFCGMKSFKSHHRIRDFLDETVVLLNNIVQIFNLEYFNKTDQTGQHQQEVDILQPGLVSATFIHDDFHGKAIAINRLPEKGSGRCFIPMLGEHKINGIAKFINSTV